jgi:hypothetical protein
MSKETFETTTEHKIHVLHAKSCLRIIIGVDLQFQLQLQHETLKLMLKLKIGSEKKTETGFRNFVSFRVELSTLIFLLGATLPFLGDLKSQSLSCVVDIMILD